MPVPGTRTESLNSLYSNRKRLTPCQPGVARSLLNAGKASVFRRYPFTIILNKEVDANPEPLELKLDPGSKVSGIALKQGNHIIFAAELQHRGQQIVEALRSRRQRRRSRRNRKTRYRPARFLNQTRSEGWLAPSLQHRVDTLMTWVNRFRESLDILTSKPLLILAKGHGTRRMCGTNKYGFPTRHRSRRRIHNGFQTSDIVTATVTAGTKIGSYVGQVLCRASGRFNITTASGRVAGISHKYCKPIHRKDGYAYA
ncbi:MAG: RRXRR domain-containing protein [Phormidium sp. PBR-2020]|nr:MAG: RRXRR domain-containing protein [Phormidium sp. PBR-2020]